MVQPQGRTVYVAVFCLHGRVEELRVYSDIIRAQRALRRYVRYSDLLASVKLKNPQATRARATLDAYGAIARTKFAGSSVWEADVDSRIPVKVNRQRGEQRTGQRRSSARS